MNEMNTPEQRQVGISLLEYGKANFRPLFLTMLIFIIFFIPYLGNIDPGFDTAYFINEPGTTINWLQIGRQGQVLIHKLFYFAPELSLFFCQGMTLITCGIVLFIFCYLFHRAARVPAWQGCLFFLLSMVHPICAEQYYYIMQMFDIAVGVLLIPVTLLLTYHPRRTAQFIGIPLMIWVFSIYQTFSILYIAMCILVFLLQYIHQGEGEGATQRKFPNFQLGVKQALLFLIAFSINTIITKLFFTTSDYLTNQRRWGLDPASVCWDRVKTNIVQVLTGEGTFYSLTFTCSVILVGIAAAVFLNRNWEKREKSFFLFALILLETTPFLLTIYGGIAPAYRAQFVLPFAVAANFLLAMALLPRFRFDLIWLKLGTGVLCAGLCYIFMGQYYVTAQLQYTTTMIRESNQRQAYAIEEALVKETNGRHKPVAFIGIGEYWNARKTNAYIVGDVTTLSPLVFGFGLEPRYHDSTMWATWYMQAIGIDISKASSEQMIIARQIARDMPVWPQDGCIKELDDFVVMKLSPDICASEIMEPGAVKTVIEAELDFDATLRASLDLVSNEEGVLVFRGWLNRPYQDSSYVTPGVHVWDETTNELYTLATEQELRTDVTAFYSSEWTNYDCSGFLAKAPLEQLPASLERSRIILSLTDEVGTRYMDTGQYIADWHLDI